MEIDISLIHLAGIQSLSNLNESLSILTKEIAILRDERDEYRRKWIEATKCDEDIDDVKTIQAPSK